MVADLFHYGHVNYLNEIYKMKKEGDLLFVGIHNDNDTLSYKRLPILTMNERVKVLESCKYIDKVIPNAALRITEEYINKNKIDLVFTPDNRTESEIKLMLEVPYSLGIVRKIPYTPSISTSDIIKRIQNRGDL